MEYSISTLAYDLHRPVEPRLRDFRAAGFTVIDRSEQYATAYRYTERDAVDALVACERHGIRIAMMHGATHLSMPGKGSTESRDALWRFDSGHAHVRNELDILASYAEGLIATRLYDNDGLSDQHLLPGQGDIDWRRVISALKRSRYAGSLNVEVMKPKGAKKAKWCAEAYTRIKEAWQRY